MAENGIDILFENLDINDHPIIYIDNSIDTNHQCFITKIKINFYQLFTLFRELPTVYESGKCKYEWKFTDITGTHTYSIYDWNNKNKLINTTEWYIGANSLGKQSINNFLKVLCDAMKYYHTYYKCIEKNIFNSNIPNIDFDLKQLHQDIVLHKETLKIL